MSVLCREVVASAAPIMPILRYHSADVHLWGCLLVSRVRVHVVGSEGSTRLGEIVAPGPESISRSRLLGVEDHFR